MSIPQPGRSGRPGWNDTRELYAEALMIDLSAVVSEAATVMVEPVRSARRKGPRGTSDKTGEGTRNKIKASLLRLYGPYCHLCLLWGLPLERAVINLELRFPDPECFTRDHLKPRSLKGALHSIRNQRPAHNRCNSFRGNKTLAEIAGCRPAWATQGEE